MRLKCTPKYVAMNKMAWPTTIQQMERTRMPCKHVMASLTSLTPRILSVLLGNEKAMRARETADPEAGNMDNDNNNEEL